MQDKEMISLRMVCLIPDQALVRLVPLCKCYEGEQSSPEISLSYHCHDIGMSMTPSVSSIIFHLFTFGGLGIKLRASQCGPREVPLMSSVPAPG